MATACLLQFKNFKLLFQTECQHMSMCTCWKKGRELRQTCRDPHLLLWAKAQPMAWARSKVCRNMVSEQRYLSKYFGILGTSKGRTAGCQAFMGHGHFEPATKSMSAVNRVICTVRDSNDPNISKHLAQVVTGSVVPCCASCAVFWTQGRLLTSFACCSTGSICCEGALDHTLITSQTCRR